MHGREEQWEELVLVQHSSQHKRIEQPVWPVFPDYLSISCDYDDADFKVFISFEFHTIYDTVVRLELFKTFRDLLEGRSENLKCGIFSILMSFDSSILYDVNSIILKERVITNK